MTSKSHKGRKRLGKEPFAHVAFAIPPTVSDAIDTLTRSGYGTRSSIARTLVETGLDSGALETFGSQTSPPDAEGDAEPTRKPGPGRQRVGRDRMVNVSTMIEPAKLEQIMAVAEPTGLPRGDALRRLLTSGYERMLAEGYRNLPAYKRSLRKKKAAPPKQDRP
jgi:hypothetical protein